MALLPIIEFPDERLRRKSAIVSQDTIMSSSFQLLLDNMIETMYQANGIGLAAPQVGALHQCMVIDTSVDRKNPMVFINPRLISFEGERSMKEGCLSLPGGSAMVKRADSILVNSVNREGAPQIVSADGLFATCIQHEMDHLEGKLFIDHLSGLKRDALRNQMRRNRRHSG